MKKKTYLDKDKLPVRAGVYLVEHPNHGFSAEPMKVEVYRHPLKGLCCFADDIGSSGTGVDDRYDCHVSVQFTGLKFIRRIGNLTSRLEKIK